MGFNLAVPFFKSLQVKVLTALMLGLGISVSLLILQMSSSKLSALMELGKQTSRDQTLLAASQARLGVENEDERFLENIYFDLVFKEDEEGYDAPTIQMLRVTAADGTRLKSYETLDGPHVDPATLDDLARVAMINETVQEWREGDLIAFSAPVFSDRGRQVIGAISIAWDHGHLRAALVPSISRSATIGIAGSAVVILLLGLMMQRLVLRPIRRLDDAVMRIERSGDLSDMPKGVLERQDEVGRLATRFNALLSQTNEKIIARSRQLDTALGSMAQGLALFDDAHRLVLSNRRVEEIYGLAEGALYPGMHLRDVLRICRDAGIYSDERVVELEKALVKPARTQQPTSHLENISEDRIISVVRAPMPTGGWVATYEDVTERKRAEAQIEHMALHDALTGLPNRVSLRRELDEALCEASRAQKLSVLCLDLDHFKPVNDTLGHPVGDALLQQVAERLTRCLRKSSVVARLSGDEFAIVEKNVTSVEAISKLAERLVMALSEPYEIDGHQIVIGASVGIAIAPSDGCDADKLIKAADLALYRAKTEGRGTYRFFEEAMDAKMQERRALELDLRAAFAKDELELHYQPIVNLETGRVSCFEALLRWRHATRGPVSPAVFVTLAEEIGLITELGRWVLHEACQMAAQWPDDVRVAVNLSSVQFRSLALVAEIEAALETAGLKPDRLELEITETVLLRQTELTLSILERLRQLGVRISMDDFGTGYSSLSYLRTFPFDKIKIDRSFIKDVDHHGDAQAIVRAISSMGASLGMTTTAEGVETIAQLEVLRLEGCTEVQGFYFSPAVHDRDVRALMEHIDAGDFMVLQKLGPSEINLAPLSPLIKVNDQVIHSGEPLEKIETSRAAPDT